MWKVSGSSRFERRLLGLKGRSWSTCPARPYSDISHGKYCEYSGQSRPRCPTGASFEWTLLNMNLRRSNFILWCCIECVDVEVAWVLRGIRKNSSSKYESHMKQVPRVYDLSDMTRRCHDSLEKGQYWSCIRISSPRSFECLSLWVLPPLLVWEVQCHGERDQSD